MALLGLFSLKFRGPIVLKNYEIALNLALLFLAIRLSWFLGSVWAQTVPQSCDSSHLLKTWSFDKQNKVLVQSGMQIPIFLFFSGQFCRHSSKSSYSAQSVLLHWFKGIQSRCNFSSIKRHKSDCFPVFRTRFQSSDSYLLPCESWRSVDHVGLAWRCCSCQFLSRPCVMVEVLCQQLSTMGRVSYMVRSSYSR